VSTGTLLVSEMNSFSRKMSLLRADQNKCLEFIAKSLRDTRSQETLDISQDNFAMAAIVEDFAQRVPRVHEF